jgi:ADP-heptose:LPS heptosyltransferase
VIRLGAVGDVVRTLPAAQALRRAYPGSHLAWLVEPASASALANQPWLDEVIVFPREALRAALRGVRLARAARTAWDFARLLRSRRFDLVVDFHAILKSGVLARLSGAATRVGYAPPYARELAWWFVNRRARVSPPRSSRFDRNQALVRFLGVAAAPTTRAWRPPAALLSAVDAELGLGARPVVLHPGTSVATPHKRWSPERYAAVARALHKELGVGSIVSYGPSAGERELALEVVRGAEGGARLAPRTQSLAELAALFSRCRLYVGGDTGPLHVASLVGTPVVQILGPTDPVENAPYPGTPSRSVRVPVACSPCRRGCAAALCMRVVPPEAVIRAARELLAGQDAG